MVEIKKTLPIYLFIIFIGQYASGQDLHYEIVKGDKQIGSLEVMQTINGSSETIQIRNLVEFKVLFSFKVDYTMEETFVNGALNHGHGYNTLNGITQKETSIRLDNDGYHLKIDGVEARNETIPIKESMSKIYHVEPFDGKQLYSQYFGRYLTAEKTGDHQYVVNSEDGQNFYTFRDGYCYEVKIIRDFATFYIRMKPETIASIKQYKAKSAH